MNKTPSFRVWLSRLKDRFRLLLYHTPFADLVTPWVAFAAVAIGVLAFVFGALESFGLFAAFTGPNYPGLPSLIAYLFPGPSSVLLALALMIPVWSMLTFLADGYDMQFSYKGRRVGFHRPPIIGFFVVWSLAMSAIFPLHTVRIVSDPKAGLLIDQRKPLEEFFGDWVEKCVPAGPVRPVIVAISGGASRAAIWGARVLQQVESSSGQGKPIVFAVSSVSGGSLGTAAYFSLLSQLSSQDLCSNNGTNAARQTQLRILASPRLARDALGPLLAGYLFVDVPRTLFAPLAYVVNRRGGDRAEAIERAFEGLWRDTTQTAGTNGLAPAPAAPPGVAQAATPAPGSPGPVTRPGRRNFDQHFLSLFYEGTGLRHGMPIWIANGTDMASGARSLTVPFGTKGAWPFRGAADTLSALGADVQISTAINNTARFPFLEPSGELVAYQESEPRTPHLDKSRPFDVGEQIIDGGYFENAGLQTALDLAEWLKAKGPAYTQGRPVDPIIVQATADGAAGIPLEDIVRCESPPDDPASVVEGQRPLQLTAPVFGLYNVRSAHTAVLLRQAKKTYCQEGKKAFFHFFLTGNGKKDVPLNWILSDATARYIWSAMDAKGSGNTAEHKSMTAAFSAQQ